MKKFYLFFAVVLLFYGCSLTDTDKETILYMYTGYDSTGVMIVSGKLVIDFLEEGKLEGQWQLSPAIGPSGAGLGLRLSF